LRHSFTRNAEMVRRIALLHFQSFVRQGELLGE